MKPYYSEKGITIYHGDCRDVLPCLQKMDLVLTDPPYGLADKLQGGTWGKKFLGKHKAWDALTVEEVPELIKIGTNQIVWGGNYYSLMPSRGWLVWNKPERGLTMADAELAWVNKDMNIRVFDCSRNPNNEKRQHPTQKPLKLFTWCISLFPGTKTVVDMFAGSCTTARAAKDLGLHCVCIEKDEQYCESGAKRLQQEVLSLE